MIRLFRFNHGVRTCSSRVLKYLGYPPYLFLARRLNLAAMSDLRSGVLSQTQEVLHLPGVFEIVFLRKLHKRTEEFDNGQATTWNIEA